MERNRTEQNGTERNRTEQNGTERNRMEQNGTERNRNRTHVLEVNIYIHTLAKLLAIYSPLQMQYKQEID